MEWLKLLFGDELFNQLFPANSDALKKVSEKIGTKKFIEDDGKLIPKHRFDEVSAKLNDPETGLQAVTAKLTKVNGELDALKKEKEGGKKTVDEQIQILLQKQTDLENLLKTKDAELVVNNKRGAVEKLLRANKVNEQYLAVAMREFELKHPLDKLEVIDGTLKEADTIMKPFVETNKIFFGEFKREGTEPKPGDPGYGEPDYSKMTDAEYFNHRQTKK